MLFLLKLYYYVFTIFLFLIYLFSIIPIGFFLKYVLRIELYKTRFSNNKSYKESVSDKKKIN